ncbi:MAG: hypothetical protein JXR46_06225 [Calditrichaceae bacterium]|nr:hypothetical protein [Calditrichaceae bacterium]MBN2708623.1 hypothetical protein [Calditrichaceae bacterium]RQV95473.1 MAG: hypothetical protein EH224_07585 [Calditrichota bacterium]
MINRKISLKIILKFGFILLFACSDPNDNFDFDNFPSITGIIVTTVEAPDGTGEVYGNPSYSISGPSEPLSYINIFPNPYLGVSILEPSPDKKFICFSHLPDSVRIEISVGIYKNQKETVHKNMRSRKNPIRTIQKTDTSHSYLQWNLKDDNDEYIETGFYSINIFDIQENSQRIDAYIILPDQISECSVWDDPTGWLPGNWRYMNTGSSVIYTCDPVMVY